MQIELWQLILGMVVPVLTAVLGHRLAVVKLRNEYKIKNTQMLNDQYLKKFEILQQEQKDFLEANERYREEQRKEIEHLRSLWQASEARVSQLSQEVKEWQRRYFELQQEQKMQYSALEKEWQQKYSALELVNKALEKRVRELEEELSQFRAVKTSSRQNKSKTKVEEDGNNVERGS